MGEITYQRGTVVPPFGCICASTPGKFPLYQGLDPTNLGAHAGKGLLIVAAPFDTTVTTTTPGPLPFGTAPTVGRAYTFTTTGGPNTIYPAATHGGTTSPDDTPANAYIPSKFTGDVQMQLSLFSGANPTQAGEMGIGELQLLDPEGELDPLLDLGWEGADIELRRGMPGTLYASWSPVMKLTAAGMVGDTDAKSLRVRPLSWLLDAAELHGERYGGSGGADGDAALAGRLKPYGVGYVSGATPVMVNAVALVMQVSRSSINSVSVVADGRVPLSAGADYPTYEQLAAATVAPGSFATCLARGFIRLGSAPVFGITVDFLGDNDTVNGLPGPTTRGKIVRRIAAGLGAVRLHDATQIDFRAFNAFESRQPDACGWYWDGGQTVSKAAAISEVLAGVCGWWLVRPSGKLAIGQVEAPEDYAAALAIDFPGSGAGEVRANPPTITDTLPPRRATYIGYARNYTPNTQDQIADSVSQTDALIYGQPTQYAGGIDLWRANNYPTSPAVYLMANYRDAAAAAREATRQMRIFDQVRRRYAMPIPIDPQADVVGLKVKFNNLNRLGWGASKNLLVCGIETAGTAVTLHLWV